MKLSSAARRTASLVLGLVLVTAVIAGCQTASNEVRFDLAVSEAVVEEGVPETGPGTQDLAVKVTWTATTVGLDAHVTNPADTTAAILWEGATFSYGSAEPEPLVATAPHATPDLPQMPTEVPRNGQMIIGMLPRSHAEWEWSANRTMGGTWEASGGMFDIVLTPEQSESERRATAEAAVGRKAMIKIPIRTGSRVLTYIFDVRVKGAEVYSSYH
jgi:hypothetical protein